MSDTQIHAQIFDPDNYLIGEHQSPGLVPINPSFDVVETPPPIATTDSSVEPSEDEEEEGRAGNKELTENAEEIDGTDLDLIEPPEAMEREALIERPKVNGFHDPSSTADPKELTPAPGLTRPQLVLDVKPPPRPSPIKTGAAEEDSLAKSPALARFTINPADGDPSNTLPAMQMSHPRPSVAGSPEARQNLPSLTSLTTTLSDGGTPCQLSQYGPSPHSSMSPPTRTSQPSFWRTNTREGSVSTPFDYAIVSASGSVSTPASSIIHQSPAGSHPAPTLNSPDQATIDGSIEHVLSPESDEHEPNGINGQFGCNSYKCNAPGCTAAAFQTQYLLDSHKNVHSDTRPHFYLEKGCARGPGGQGFRRKNEMIWHGLVHTSPGYMCPFCLDQQHKYPRPDNLQRHARIHHVDKDRDDPLLREVLAQRPEGGSRGRRRRLGS